jgi:hypothetical protein
MTKENFSNYNVQLLHFEGADRSYTVGSNDDPLKNVNVTNVEVTATDNGLKFTTSSFSPFVLLYEAKATNTEGSQGNPSVGSGSGSGSTSSSNSNQNNGSVDETPTETDVPSVSEPGDDGDGSGLVGDASKDPDDTTPGASTDDATPGTTPDGSGLVQDAYYDDGSNADKTADDNSINVDSASIVSANNAEGNSADNSNNANQKSDDNSKKSALAKTGDVALVTAGALVLIALAAMFAAFAITRKHRPTPKHARRS